MEKYWDMSSPTRQQSRMTVSIYLKENCKQLFIRYYVIMNYGDEVWHETKIFVFNNGIHLIIFSFDELYLKDTLL